MNSKACTKCETLKPFTDFYRAKAMKDGRASWCKKCTSSRKRKHSPDELERMRQWRRKPENLAREQERSFQRRYGISSREYEEMVMAQCGLCAICQEPETRQRNGEVSRLAVHHNHDTGEVVALLCHACNTGLGLLGDSPERLRLAALIHEGN